VFFALDGVRRLLDPHPDSILLVDFFYFIWKKLTFWEFVGNRQVVWIVVVVSLVAEILVMLFKECLSTWEALCPSPTSTVRRMRDSGLATEKGSRQLVAPVSCAKARLLEIGLRQVMPVCRSCEARQYSAPSSGDDRESTQLFGLNVPIRLN
jgi:hypothetical protein